MLSNAVLLSSLLCLMVRVCRAAEESCNVTFWIFFPNPRTKHLMAVSDFGRPSKRRDRVAETKKNYPHEQNEESITEASDKFGFTVALSTDGRIVALATRESFYARVYQENLAEL